MKKAVLLGLLSFLFTGMTCRRIMNPVIYTTENIEVKLLQTGVYQHVSWITLSNGTSFPCNGLIYEVGEEVVVFDSPVTDEATADLIQWLEEKDKKIKGIVVNHFHDDCTKGLEQFKAKNAQVYMNSRTFTLLEEPDNPDLYHLFDRVQTLDIGGKKIENRYFGPAHTQDNIVSYLPAEKVLFGGCQVKSYNASKGNLADADTLNWSKSIEAIKKAYPELYYVVPGHGEAGGTPLLDYTQRLFSVD